MSRYFFTAFVAALVFVSAAGGTFAHGTLQNAEPPAPRDSFWVGESGTASYYGSAFEGRRAANGALYDENALTAAHPWLPFGTKVKVTLVGTTRNVIVTITDRLGSATRVVDLSVAAARQLGIINRGIAAVTLLPV